MVKRSDLKVGMEVRHKISGSVGEVRGLDCADFCVKIRMRTKTGKNKGKFQYSWWYVENLEIVN